MLSLPITRRLDVLSAILALTLSLAPLPVPAAEPVALELVLALDASNSVSDQEFRLQVEGLAAAFAGDEVIQGVVQQTPDGLAVTLMQWSNPNHQVTSVPWRLLRNAEDSRALAEEIRQVAREVKGGTAISGALTYAQREIAGNAYEGRRKVIDVSGDGPDLHQIFTRRARDLAVAAGITINGLTILDDSERLDAFYRSHVIGGDGAFVMTANNFEDYRAAIREKLLRELGGPPIAGHTRTPVLASKGEQDRE